MAENVFARCFLIFLFLAFVGCGLGKLCFVEEGMLLVDLDLWPLADREGENRAVVGDKFVGLGFEIQHFFSLSSRLFILFIHILCLAVTEVKLTFLAGYTKAARLNTT